MRFFAFWGFIKMNILIVGNGFDLSHYLPTKYDHFMDVMGAIEEKDLSKYIKTIFNSSVKDLPTLFIKGLEIKNALNEKHYEMGFDELFSKCREKWFIDKTRKMYAVSSIILSFEDLVVLQAKLKNNIWYQYFAQHIREVKTWIDFETKINDALKVVANFVVKLENKLDEVGAFDKEVCFYGESEKRQIFLTRETCNILEKLNILSSGYYIDQTDCDENGSFTIPIDIGDSDVGDLRFYIRDENIINYFGYGKLNKENLLNNLQLSLDDFIEIFNLYLEKIVSKLSLSKNYLINLEGFHTFDKIISFNYTNTYQRIHENISIEYLHGSHGENQNIVLGISDLDDDSLKKLKAYGFTKYHQKLFKDTHYLFLDEFKRKILLHKKSVDDFERDYHEVDKASQRKLFGIGEKLNLRIAIWGHSLDISDKDYILDLFSLNDDIDRNVRVTVYYFDKTAKFSLLNNLLAILGKDKVEQWMKNKWLCFKPNPEIKFLAQESSDVDQAS